MHEELHEFLQKSFRIARSGSEDRRSFADVQVKLWKKKDRSKDYISLLAPDLFWMMT